MKVLFVCSGNAFRSPVAEALLKKFRPDVEVDSAGTFHSLLSAVAESAREYLAREDAERYLKKTPESLDGKPLESYDLIVVMEQRHKNVVLSRCPECASKTVVWNIEDPYFLPSGYAEKVFNQIRQKVKELADSL